MAHTFGEVQAGRSYTDLEVGSQSKASIDLSRVSLPGRSSYESLEDFVVEQTELRAANLKEGGQKVLMCSHCWRNPSTQEGKRKLIASMGWSYWSDFLDLAEDGGGGEIVYNMFPKHVADALMRGERATEDRQDCATVLFCDIAGFTTLSAQLDSTKVSDLLNRLFKQFDDAATLHGIHKLETIGDCYIGVSNLVEAQPTDHVARMARFSLDMLAAAERTVIDVSDPARGHVQVRVGFDSGPVVGNVVGTRHLKYTVFGNTVNTASRMESSGLPGRVQCTERAAALLREQDGTVSMEERGAMEIKGKGTMTTYWLLPQHTPPETANSPSDLHGGCDDAPLSLGPPAVVARLDSNAETSKGKLSRVSTMPEGEAGWRNLKEVAQGIRECAKVVSFLDTAYLRSFRCMQELALAFAHDKIVVPVVLEQAAVALLSSSQGVDEAWDAMQAMAGKELTPGLDGGRPLTKEWVAATFRRVSLMDLCMCRPEDMRADGDRIVLHRLHRTLLADLDYLREHRQLQSRALEWEGRGRSHALLLSAAAVPEKRVWVHKARKEGRHPKPTPLQEQYVQASTDSVRRALLVKQIAVCIVLLVVTGLASLATYKWIQNADSLAEVERQVQFAREQTRVAQTQTEVARTQTTIAETRLYLFSAKSDPHRNGYAQAAVREALAVVDGVPRAVREEIWEARTELVREVERHTTVYPVHRFGNPTAVACCWSGAGDFSPDMKWIAFASTQATGLINLYHLTTGRTYTTSIPGANIYSVFWPRGAGSSHFLVVETSPAARILRVHLPAPEIKWEEVGSYRRNSSEPAENVLVAWHSSGEQVAVMFEAAGRLSIFDTTQNTERLLLQEPGTPVGGVDWSSDDTLLAHATGSTVRVWDLVGNGTWTLQHEEAELVIAVAFAPDSQRLVTAAQSGLLLVWTLAHPELGGVVLDTQGEIKSPRLLGWSPDGRRLAVASNLQSRLYDMQRMELDAVVQTEVYVETLQWGADSRHLGFFGIQGQVVVARIEEPRHGAAMVPSLSSGAISDLKLNHDDTLLLSTSLEAVMVTELATGLSRVLFTGQSFASADWSPDGTRVAAVDSEGMVTIVDVKDGRNTSLGAFTDLDWDFGDGGFPINRFELVWSPDGTKIAVSYTWGKRVAVWDVASGEVRNIANGISLSATVVPLCIGVRWSRDSRRLVLAPMWDDFAAHVSQTVVTIISVEDGRLQQLVGDTSLIWAPPEFSPDGRKIAFAGIEHVSVWEEGADGQWAYRKLGDDGTVSDVEWRADGRSVLTVSQRGTLREWDVSGGCGGSQLLDVALEAGKRGPRLAISKRSDVDTADSVLVATDGQSIRLLSATATHDEVVQRQSAAVSRERMRAHYGLRDSPPADQSECQT